MALTSASLPVGAPLCLAIEDQSGKEWPALQCSLARVDEHEDTWILASGLRAAPDAKGLFRLTPPDPIAPGLYCVAEVVFYPSERSDPSEPGALRFIPPEPILFEIRDPSRPPRAADALAAAYQTRLREREAAFLAGVGPSSGRERFQAFVFLRDCLVTEPMRLGQCEVGPAPGLGSQQQTAFLNAFLREIGAEGEIEDGPNVPAPSHPCATVHFPIVRAHSPNEAMDIASGEARLVSDVLGAFRSSYGSVFAGLVVDSRGVVTFAREFPRYRGNMLGGFLSGEQPAILRHVLALVRTDPRRALYLGMLREALREDRWEFQAFRFWNILEAIARNKDYEGHSLRAKDLVLELLRERFGQGVPSLAWGAPLAQGVLPEIVVVWYQRRNCVAHTGACQPQNPAVCRVNKASCVSCKRAHEEVVAAAADGTGFGDGYLEALRQTVLHLVQAECL